MPTKPTFISWLHEHFDQAWPVPTLVPNVIDIIFAPVYDGLVNIFNKPTAFWNRWKQAIENALGSYGVESFLGLSYTAKADVVAGWWETFCDVEGIAPYAQENGGGN